MSRTGQVPSGLAVAFLTFDAVDAVATHVRVGNPLFTHVLFPTYVAAMLWGRLALRRPAVRAVLRGA